MSRRARKRPPVKALHRHGPHGDQHFFDQARFHAERGDIVRVSRFRAPVYLVVQNGPGWLTLDDQSCPLGTFGDLEQAVAAGDRFYGYEREDSLDGPAGAA